MAIYTSDWRKDAPVRAEVYVATTEGRKVEALVERMQAIFDEEEVGRDVALAVVAGLGARYADQPQAPSTKTRRRA